MHKHHQLLLPASFLLFALLLTPVVHSATAAWAKKSWKYRFVTRVVPDKRRGGIDTARVAFREQSKHCAPDGHDIRVVDENGKLLPHRVKETDRGLVAFFKVHPGADKYYIYYGNPEASAAAHQWNEKLGGLTLETFEFRHRTYSASRIPSLLDANPKRFGKSEWPQINDLENPFGQNDHYLSRYTGTIYCPEEGRYTFAVNADDMAMFRLLMDGETLVKAWRNGGVPSENWEDPEHKHAYMSMEDPLKPGVYRFVYYHGENGGAQLAKLGWKKPSSDSVVTVPPRAFVRYLPVTIMGRQKLGQRINPFFTAEHRYTLVVNDKPTTFPHYHFQSRSTVQNNDVSSYRWAFGDGQEASGQSVIHEFPELKPYNVTLTITTQNGKTASITRRITPSPKPRKRMTLRMDAQFENRIPILPAGDRAQLKVFVKNVSSLPHKVLFQNTLEDDSNGTTSQVVDTQTVEELKPGVSGPGGWTMLRTSFSLPASKVYARLRLLIHGQPVTERKLAVLSTDGPLGEISVDRSGSLRDARNRLVLLRLATVNASEADPRRLYHPKSGAVRIVVIDDSLGGPMDADSRTTYISELTNLLQDRYPHLKFSIIRPQLGLSNETSIVQRFLQTRRKILNASPNLVVIAAQPETVLNNVPLEAFQSYLLACLDQVSNQTRAGALLITPPPLPARPQLSSKYAAVAKKIGLKTNIGVVDVYSRLRLTSRWKKLFRRKDSQHRSYHIHPNEQGQTIVARELFNSIVQKYGEAFSEGNARLEP